MTVVAVVVVRGDATSLTLVRSVVVVLVTHTCHCRHVPRGHHGWEPCVLLFATIDCVDHRGDDGPLFCLIDDDGVDRWTRPFSGSSLTLDFPLCLLLLLILLL